MVEKYFQKNKNLVKIQANLLKYLISFKLKQLFNRHVLKLPPVLWHDRLATKQAHHKIINFKLLDRIYQQCSICDLALEVLDEVRSLKFSEATGRLLGTLKITTAFRVLEEANKHHSEFMNCFQFLIG